MASERCRNDRLAELLRRQFSGEIVRRHLRIRCNGMRCYSRSSCGRYRQYQSIRCAIRFVAMYGRRDMSGLAL